MTGTARPQSEVVGTSVEGRPIECHVFGEGPDTILIMATIHGDEAAGTPLVDRLMAHLRENPDLLQGRRIVVVPNANPDGMAHGTRMNARGVDLNRNFPASNFSHAARHGENPLSEPESRALHKVLLAHKPNRIISIHQPRTLPACIDYDGPGAALAKAMSVHTDLPLKRLGSRPGSLGAYAGDTLRTPIITLEIPRTHDDMNGAALWKRYGKMMLAAIEYSSGVN